MTLSRRQQEKQKRKHSAHPFLVSGSTGMSQILAQQRLAKHVLLHISQTTPTEKHDLGYYNTKSTVQRGRDDHVNVMS